MVTQTVSISAALILLIGCARAGTPTAAQQQTQPGASAVDGSAADVARIVCEKDAVVLRDDTVRAQLDGVHLLVENPGGAWGIDLHHEIWDYGTGEGFKLSDDATPDTSGMGPGTVTVACVPTARSSYYDTGVPRATLTIVDPDGLYVPGELECGFGEQFRLTISGSQDEQPTSVVRRVPGVLPSDEFERPNYPDSPLYWPVEFIVERDGQAVARAMGPYDVDDGSWHLIVNACRGSGIHE
jgi:hypothetical protein